MIGIVVENKRLDLYENTSIEFTLNNPAFVGGDLDKVTGSYSFPLTVPLTTNNRQILNYPDLIENTSSHFVDKDCEILFDGVQLFSGLLTIKQTVKKDGLLEAKVYLIIDTYKQLKKTKLPELDLSSHTFADTAATLAAAKDSAENPLNYDYCFFPIMNLEFFGSDDPPL